MPKISRSLDARLRWTHLRDAGDLTALQAAYFAVSARQRFLVAVAEDQSLCVADLEKAAARGEINRIPPVDRPLEAHEFPTPNERRAQRIVAGRGGERMGAFAGSVAIATFASAALTLLAGLYRILPSQLPPDQTEAAHEKLDTVTTYAGAAAAAGVAISTVSYRVHGAMQEASWAEDSMNAAAKAWRDGTTRARDAIDGHLQSSGRAPLSDKEFGDFMADVVTDIDAIRDACFPPLRREPSTPEGPPRRDTNARLRANIAQTKGLDLGLQ